ncbi:MAG: hypothetical protein JNJ60_00865, partial [Rhodocyclaceae bacterium]|nr:hypothetical protein [Rhodocyclaceae bacterium]
MSTTAEVVQDAAQLLRELAALLATKTAQEVPNIAADLGAQGTLNQGIEALRKLLATLRRAVVPLRHAALEADALVALLGFLPPLIAGLGEAVQSSGEWLETLDLHLDGAAAAAGDAAEPLRTASGALEMGVDVAEGVVSLVAPGELKG